VRTLTILVSLAFAMPVTAQTLDEAVAPGANYNIAEFRFWAPKTASPLRAIVVLVPGSNGDGRGQVDDAVWQAFATTHSLAFIGCRFTDTPHDQSFIEEYVKVASAPLFLWGMSAGGQFNYEFAAWKPERSPRKAVRSVTPRSATCSHVQLLHGTRRQA
jgi:poly(3-hydroxybutyrate) depolymerase